MKKKISALVATAMLVASASVFATGCAQMGGEDTYTRVPKAQHETEFPKGHDGAKNCYYDEKNAVYFCQY